MKSKIYSMGEVIIPEAGIVNKFQIISQGRCKVKKLLTKNDFKDCFKNAKGS